MMALIFSSYWLIQWLWEIYQNQSEYGHEHLQKTENQYIYSIFTNFSTQAGYDTRSTF